MGRRGLSAASPSIVIGLSRRIKARSNNTLHGPNIKYADIRPKMHKHGFLLPLSPQQQEHKGITNKLRVEIVPWRPAAAFTLIYHGYTKMEDVA